MQLHPALAFGSALAGAALLGAVGAILALPAAAMAQALVSELGTRHAVVDSDLTTVVERRRRRRRLGYWFGLDDDQRAGPPRLEAALMLPGAVVPIAETTRSGVVESVHFGVVVALGADGSIAWSAGDPTPTCTPARRSSRCRPRRCSTPGSRPTRRARRRLRQPQRRSRVHLEVVRAHPRQGRASTRTPSATPRRCRSAPRRRRGRAARRRAGRARLLQNCSGKHAAMLVTCVANGWDVDDYLDVDHPVQKLDRRLHRRGGRRLGHTGIDGCGAPTAMVSLLGWSPGVRALAIRRTARVPGDARASRARRPAPDARTPS